MKLLNILIAIILPPLSVLKTKGLSFSLIINLPLTMLGWIPGIIHALWLMSKESDSNS